MVLEMRNLASGENGNSHFPQEESVEFSYEYKGVLYNSKLKVIRRGDPSKKNTLITVHNVGLNAFSNFGPLLNSEFMEPVSNNYCVYHIILPGQEDGAPHLGYGFVYPSMEHLADAIPKVLQHLDLKRAVFLGDGAGSNILVRFAVKNSTMIDGLILVNPTVTVKGNWSWLGEKISNLNTPFADQLMNYRFSADEMDIRPHLFDSHRQHLVNVMNLENVQQFFAEFERRTDVPIYRPIDPSLLDQCTLRCQTLIMVGDQSPFVEDTVEVNSRLNPQKTHFLKMADAGGMLLEEELFKVSEAIVFFLQGLGQIPSVIMKRLAHSKVANKVDVIQEQAVLSAVGWDATNSTNERSFNNRDQDEVIAVNSGERMPLMQENLC